MLEYTLRRVRFTQSITVQSEPAILFILYYIYFIYIHKKRENNIYYEERKILVGQCSKIICDKHFIYRLDESNYY